MMHPCSPTLDSARPLSRRALLKGAVLATVAPALWAARGDEAARPPRRAAIIGHTGGGDYGHGLELVFNDRVGIQVVAVADPDPAGCARAAAASGAAAQYADYREMLERERPELVSIGPRWTDQHHAMVSHALRCDAHVFVEKPFTQTLAEADDLIALAARQRLRIVVAHQMRLAPNILELARQLEAGRLGDLLEMRGYGKQDHRAGGEDMMVLGTHIFHLMRLFAGAPQWCTARVLQDGREITAADACAATEPIGPVAGDEIDAQFAFGGGVFGTFTSRGRMREVTGAWGLELIGSKGRARILANPWPTVLLLDAGAWQETGRAERWVPIAGDWPPETRTLAAANGRLVDDWLAAIATGREPASSGRSAGEAIEMVMAVYQAALARGRVAFPLAERGHPLGG